MGNSIVEWYHKRVRSEWKLAFCTAVILGFLIHTFRFTNPLLNHDALFNGYSSQNMVGSGRWLLSVACGFSSYFDLPWVIGVLSVLYIALTAVLVVDIFQARNPVLVMLISGILVSFPAVTESFYFGFTADGYMLAMVLAALSVRLVPIGENRFLRWAASALCVCCACGIYQAYVSFALVLAMAYFIVCAVDGNHSDRDCLRWVRNQVIAYAVAMIGYYVIWKLCLYVQDFQATNYMGINELDLVGNLIDNLLSAVREFLLFFLEYNFLRFGLTVWCGINLLFLMTGGITLAVVLAKSRLWKRKVQLALSGLAMLLIPFAAFLWLFVSDKISYCVRMEQSMSLVYILVAVLCERWCRERWSNVVALVLAAFICNNTISANIFYRHMDTCNRQSYAVAVELATRIHALDDGNVKQIAVYGELDIVEEADYFDPSKLGALGLLKSVRRTLFQHSARHVYLYLNEAVGFQLSYYRSNDEVELPVNEKRGANPVPDGWQFQFPCAPEEVYTEIQTSEAFRQMPIWPAAGCVAVYGDTVVVKLSEVSANP